jgi:hypothetical protein
MATLFFWWIALRCHGGIYYTVLDAEPEDSYVRQNFATVWRYAGRLLDRVLHQSITPRSLPRRAALFAYSMRFALLCNPKQYMIELCAKDGKIQKAEKPRMNEIYMRCRVARGKDPDRYDPEHLAAALAATSGPPAAKQPTKRAKKTEKEEDVVAVAAPLATAVDDDGDDDAASSSSSSCLASSSLPSAIAALCEEE